MKYKVGDKAIVTFLGAKYKTTIKEIRELNEERSVYSVICDNDGMYIPYVGENGSEKYANIFEEDNLTKINSNEKSKRTSKKSSKKTA